MSTTFVNRKNELDFLNQNYRKGDFSFVVVYGRRRIGKTTLVKRSCEKIPHVYMLCRKTSIKNNLQIMAENIRVQLNISYFPNFNSYEDLFKFLKSLNIPIVVVIDEFPYLVELDKSMPSTFQYIVDEILFDSKLKLILVGSSVSMMEEHVLSEKSPLYGRRSGQIKLKHLNYYFLKEFYDLEPEELVKIYGMIGGVPFYLNNLNVKSFSEAFYTIFNKNNIFYEEGEFLLKQELKEPRNYKLILEAISKGKIHFNEIINYTGIEKNALSKYLEKLEGLAIIEKQIPYLSSFKTKKTIYNICDEFISFWFRFIDYYKSRVEIDDWSFFEEFEKVYNAYLGSVYEKIASEFLLHSKGKYFAKQWGSYKVLENRMRKTRTYEIDLLNVDDRNKTISAYEVKWKTLSKKDVLKTLEELENKLKLLPLNIENYKIETGVIIKDFEEETSMERVYTVHDLFNLYGEKSPF